MKHFMLLGAIFGLLAVTLGAFGAHALKARLPESLLATYEVGVRYQMYHALALFVVAWLVSTGQFRGIHIAGWLFTAGILIFSGSLYALALSGLRMLGAITPIGGVCFLAGWLWIIWTIWRQ